MDAASIEDLAKSGLVTEEELLAIRSGRFAKDVIESVMSLSFPGDTINWTDNCTDRNTTANSLIADTTISDCSNSYNSYDDWNFRDINSNLISTELKELWQQQLYQLGIPVPRQPQKIIVNPCARLVANVTPIKRTFADIDEDILSQFTPTAYLERPKYVARTVEKKILYAVEEAVDYWDIPLHLRNNSVNTVANAVDRNNSSQGTLRTIGSRRDRRRSNRINKENTVSAAPTVQPLSTTNSSNNSKRGRKSTSQNNCFVPTDIILGMKVSVKLTLTSVDDWTHSSIDSNGCVRGRIIRINLMKDRITVGLRFRDGYEHDYDYSEIIICRKQSTLRAESIDYSDNFQSLQSLELLSSEINGHERSEINDYNNNAIESDNLHRQEKMINKVVNNLLGLSSDEDSENDSPVDVVTKTNETIRQIPAVHVTQASQDLFRNAFYSKDHGDSEDHHDDNGSDSDDSDSSFDLQEFIRKGKIKQSKDTDRNTSTMQKIGATVESSVSLVQLLTGQKVTTEDLDNVENYFNRLISSYRFQLVQENSLEPIDTTRVDSDISNLADVVLQDCENPLFADQDPDLLIIGKAHKLIQSENQWKLMLYDIYLRDQRKQIEKTIPTLTINLKL